MAEMSHPRAAACYAGDLWQPLVWSPDLQDREISDLIEEALIDHLDALDRDRAAQRYKPIPRHDRKEELAPHARGQVEERNAPWP
jgi:hypothetical protein